MPFTPEELEQHSIWNTITSLKEELASFDSRGDAEILRQSGILGEVAQAAVGLRQVPAWRFTGAPGTPQDPLSELEEALASAAAVIAAANTQVGDTAADSAAELIPLPDAVEATVRTLNTVVAQTQPLISSSESADAVADGLRQSATAALASLQTQITARDAEMNALEARVDERKAELDAALAALEVAIAASATNVAAQVTRLETAIADHKTSFTERQTEWQGAYKLAMESFDEESRRTFTVQEASAEASLREIRILEGEVRNLATSTAVHKLGRGYDEYARVQERQARWWSVAAVLATFAGIGFLLWTLSGIKDVSTGEAVFKSTASLAILAAGGYMARVSSGHFREARDARRVQLDLDAIEAFIANFDGDTKTSVRTIMALRTFGRPSANGRHDEANSMSSGIPALVEQLVQKVRFGAKDGAAALDDAAAP